MPDTPCVPPKPDYAALEALRDEYIAACENMDGYAADYAQSEYRDALEAAAPAILAKMRADDAELRVLREVAKAVTTVPRRRDDSPELNTVRTNARIVIAKWKERDNG